MLGAGATLAGVVIAYYLFREEAEMEYDVDEKVKYAEARRRAYRQQVVNLVFRAMKSVALADGVFHEVERSLLRHCEDVLTVKCPELDAIATITPEELASHPIFAEDPKKQAFLLMVLVHLALVDGDEHPAEFALVQRFADAFGAEPSVLQGLRSQILQEHVASKEVLGERHPALIRRKSSQSTAAVLLSSTGGLRTSAC